MTTITRVPSQEYPLTRELSLEETYELAYLARRKSSSSSMKELRKRLGTAQLLESLENVIRNSPPPSPQQTCIKPAKQLVTCSALDSTKQPSSPVQQEVDEYGFAYDDYDDEDDGLSLARTDSHHA